MLLMVRNSNGYPGRYWYKGNFTPRFYAVRSSGYATVPAYPFGNESLLW